MHDEAATLASSILKQICSEDRNDVISRDMMESAGMVLVQALKEQGR